MNKYTELSDFEINVKVANLVLNGEYIASEEKQEVYLAAMDGGDFIPIAYFDPCNNPADAMPIIIEHGIAFIPSKALDSCYCVKSDYSSTNKSLYRAAMEVFLMMKDG